MIELTADKTNLSQNQIDFLAIDLAVIRTMAEQLKSYIYRDSLFGYMPSEMPRLTLGGYLMRQHRLRALSDQLDEDDYQQLQETIEQFKAIADTNVVHVEDKANQELQARLRQWDAYLTDVARNPDEHIFEYTSAVQTRIIIEELMKFLSIPPYKLDPASLKWVKSLDEKLQAMWQKDKFIWKSVWQDAYPEEVYWWLYGRPLVS